MPSPSPLNMDASHEDVAPVSVAPDDLVTISRWELDALRAKIVAPASPHLDGPATELFVEPASSPPGVTAGVEESARMRRVEELERGFKAAVRDRELATALAGRPLVPGAAAQLIKLWRDDFDVFEEGGEYRVTSRDGRPVSKAVAERLADAEYAHFSPPSSRGGAAARGSGRTSASGVPAAPKTLGEAALQRWREAAPSRADPASGPIGLRRR
jgi:hypothetical protein